MIANRPAWTWIYPKDGMVLSVVLATIYREQVCDLLLAGYWGGSFLTLSLYQGLHTMYDYVGTYKYYKKTLPRAVAIDVVMAALMQMLPKSLGGKLKIKSKT